MGILPSLQTVNSFAEEAVVSTAIDNALIAVACCNLLFPCYCRQRDVGINRLLGSIWFAVAVGFPFSMEGLHLLVRDDRSVVVSFSFRLLLLFFLRLSAVEIGSIRDDPHEGPVQQDLPSACPCSRPFVSAILCLFGAF